MTAVQFIGSRGLARRGRKADKQEWVEGIACNLCRNGKAMWRRKRVMRVVGAGEACAMEWFKARRDTVLSHHPLTYSNSSPPTGSVLRILDRPRLPASRADT